MQGNEVITYFRNKQYCHAGSFAIDRSAGFYVEFVVLTIYIYKIKYISRSYLTSSIVSFRNYSFAVS